MMGRLYQIVLFDETNATKVAILANATAIQFTRELCGTDAIRFALHRDDPQLAELTVGRYVRVWDRRTATYLAAGFLAGTLDLGVEAKQPFVRVRAYGALTQLAFYRFPPGYRLVGALADNRDRLVQRFDWRRITAATTSVGGTLGDDVLSFVGGGSGNQLGAFTNTETTDLSASGDAYENGGAVVLAKTGDAYAMSGTYVTPFFDFGSAPTVFDRLRYVYRGEVDRVKTRVASFANLTDTRTFSGTPTSEPEARAVGIDLSGVAPNRYFAVEFTLTTYRNDETPALEAVEVVARRVIPGITAAGTVPSVDLGDLDVGGLSLRAALDLIRERFRVEYRLRPDGTLEFQEVPAPGAVGTVWGTDRRPTDTLSEGKHVEIVRYERDDTALANAVIAEGTGEKGTRLVAVVQDPSSQAVYGVRQALVRFDRRTLADLKSEADTYLAEYAAPRVALTCDLLDTPSGETTFAPGDLVRVISRVRTAHDGNPLDATLRIVREVREMEESGERVRIEGESKAATLTERLARWGRPVERVVCHEAGTEWTPIVTDSAEHTFTIPLPFTPTRVTAEVVEVEEDPSGTPTFSTPHGGSIEVRVTSARFGTHRMHVTVKRIAGTLDYRARVWWAAWGEEKTPSF